MAAPPPPPPEFIYDASPKLVAAETSQTFDAYAALFAVDLKVSINGKLIADGKPSWLAIERARLGKVNRRLIGHSDGYTDILVVDQFDDLSKVPVFSGGVFDARFVSRALHYWFGEDHLIHTLIIEQSGSFWSKPEN